MMENNGKMIENDGKWWKVMESDGKCKYQVGIFPGTSTVYEGSMEQSPQSPIPSGKTNIAMENGNRNSLFAS